MGRTAGRRRWCHQSPESGSSPGTYGSRGGADSRPPLPAIQFCACASCWQTHAEARGQRHRKCSSLGVDHSRERWTRGLGGTEVTGHQRSKRARHMPKVRSYQSEGLGQSDPPLSGGGAHVQCLCPGRPRWPVSGRRIFPWWDRAVLGACEVTRPDVGGPSRLQDRLAPAQSPSPSGCRVFL